MFGVPLSLGSWYHKIPFTHLLRDRRVLYLNTGEPNHKLVLFFLHYRQSALNSHLVSPRSSDGVLEQFIPSLAFSTLNLQLNDQIF